MMMGSIVVLSESKSLLVRALLSKNDEEEYASILAQH